MTEEKRKQFEAAAEPLMQWLSENCHPHMTCIVDCGRAELVEGVVAHVTDKFIKD